MMMPYMQFSSPNQLVKDVKSDCTALASPTATTRNSNALHKYNIILVLGSPSASTQDENGY